MCMLKSFFTLACLIVLYLSCANVRMNTYDFRQQILADSLRVVDSIRVTDSTRVADSLEVIRYESSDQTNRQKAQKEALEARAVDSARKAFIAIKESDTDIVSARSIVIPQGHEYTGAIDSVQRIIDSISA
jgi:hypothetical protein